MQYGWPIGVSAGDEAGPVLVPLSLDAFIVVQVELVIDNGPAAGVAFGRLALSHGPGAVAAILRGVLVRIAKEQVQVFLTGKAEFGAIIAWSNILRCLWSVRQR